MPNTNPRESTVNVTREQGSKLEDWIDLRNGKPEAGTRVMVYDANPRIPNAVRKQVAILLDPKKYLTPVFMLDSSATIVKTVTHWQPLPDDPMEHKKPDAKEVESTLEPEDDPFN